MKPPVLVALAGPNGAGKTTCGQAIIREIFGISEFVNADIIAKGLSAIAPEKAAWAAGRIMLERIAALARQRAGFSIETTLASRSFAPKVRDLVAAGYEFNLVYVWLPDPETAIRRVRERVRAGGHGIPEDVIRRRYGSGLRNFFELYKPLAARWLVYDNSGDEGRRLAAGSADGQLTVYDERMWSAVTQRFERP